MIARRGARVRAMTASAEWTRSLADTAPVAATKKAQNETTLKNG
jgi:hypothetical protein